MNVQTQKRPKTGVLFIRGMNRDLKDQFHAECIRRGMPMNAVVEEFMRLFVKMMGRMPSKDDMRTIVKKAKKKA